MGTDCGILDPVTSQWWPVREGRVRQTSGTRDNEDIPLRPSVKQPALILHKYLSEESEREESVLVFTHTPRGWGSEIRESFSFNSALSSLPWKRSIPTSVLSSGGLGGTGTGTRGQERPRGSRGCPGPSVTSTSCPGPPGASRAGNTRG